MQITKSCSYEHKRWWFDRKVTCTRDDCGCVFKLELQDRPTGSSRMPPPFPDKAIEPEWERLVVICPECLCPINIRLQQKKASKVAETIPNLPYGAIPASWATEFRLIPVEEDEKRIVLLSANPLSDTDRAKLQFMMRGQKTLEFASATDYPEIHPQIDELISTCYNAENESMQMFVAE